ncbi:hypothetical protein [Sporomusa acidovorans]|uniref:Uncharacterized protein n=1 Tax=Sporomusa acidovorans (strain ATCC 49682 / DSM 3132 / Mol) TaxID=1123286 RepID=A0ABZ3JC80_SPOA4|nr:hypothetical protein [Sporomusa acidovorans]OZC13259.1 hypothetical protein SPACI_57530 [Sporomusa acidovorans DSM 3132]SDD98978.1 hypothetical protein SAMN04488499_100697 [Sporomusa acidovorans]
MDRKPTAVEPVEKLGKISPVRPIYYFNPLPGERELRKKNRPNNRQAEKETVKGKRQQEGLIDIDA